VGEELTFSFSFFFLKKILGEELVNLHPAKLPYIYAFLVHKAEIYTLDIVGSGPEIDYCMSQIKNMINIV
jgi:hypothetical protein